MRAIKYAPKDRLMTETKNLTQLGKSVEAPKNPDEAVLETVPFIRTDGPPAVVRFTCPEFTSLCPVTGQPDFAHIVIDYAPDALLVESKSLKLFLTAFRNHGAFHEECTVMIARRVVDATKPLWLRIAGYWYPRGGIPIDVFWQTGAPPKDAWLPETGVAPYRGRG
jgi:7-cyano-7-deazaguanine reductase